MRPALLALSLLLAAAPAAAQLIRIAPERYFPLGLGDRWVYRYLRVVQMDSTARPDTTRRYAEQVVVGDTAIVGDFWKRVRVRQYSLGGTLLDEGETPVSIIVLPDSGVHMEVHYPEMFSAPVSGTALATAWQHLPRYSWGPAVVRIGGLSYPVEGAPGFAHNLLLDGFGRLISTCDGVQLATDIGLINYACRSYSGPYPLVKEWSWLVYAEVGGKVYGVMPVGAGTPETPLAPTVSAHPNPFRDASALVVTLPAPQRVTVVLYDALGRRVRTLHNGPLGAGPNRIAIAAGALPAGLYVARVSGERFTATRALTLVR